MEGGMFVVGPEKHNYKGEWNTVRLNNKLLLQWESELWTRQMVNYMIVSIVKWESEI